VDLDGDGDLDLVVGARDGTLRSWRNDGGAFTALTGRENPFAGIDCGGNSAPAFMDVNGDEMLDLVLGGRDGTLQAWSLAGTLPITVRANPFAGIDVGADSTPSFVDLDRDGDLDLVVGARDGTLRSWRNDGGAFTALTGRENPFAGIDAGGNSAPAFADLDGDGTLDLLSAGGTGRCPAERRRMRREASRWATSPPSADPGAALLQQRRERGAETDRLDGLVRDEAGRAGAEGGDGGQDPGLDGADHGHGHAPGQSRREACEAGAAEDHALRAVLRRARLAGGGQQRECALRIARDLTARGGDGAHAGRGARRGRGRRRTPRASASRPRRR
jgi:hypothetical protein